MSLSLWHRLRFTLASLNLRQRIAGTIMLIVTIAGLLLAVWAFLANRRLELNVTYDLLSQELTHYQQRLHVDPGTEPLQTAQLRIYRTRDIAELPPVVARYAPGTYGPVRINQRYLRVLVRDTEFGRLYITYDVTTQLVEQRIAVGILGLGLITTILLTAWLAYNLSGKLVDPVRQLAQRLNNIDPRERHLRIASEFANNELAPIAGSVDTFLERLDGFVEREQSFTTTASHELRTPLAVIQGAMELLREQVTDQPQAQKTLGRIERAVREMAEFTDALLLLSREEHRDDGTGQTCDVTNLLHRVIDDLRSTSPQHVIEITRAAPLRVAAPDSMVTMVIGNLLRNALEHSRGQAVHCELSEQGLSVSNYGSLDTQQIQHLFVRGFTTRRGGHGMGLYLTRRICDRYGWQVSLRNDGNKVIASVDFFSPDKPG